MTTGAPGHEARTVSRTEDVARQDALPAVGVGDVPEATGSGAQSVPAMIVGDDGIAGPHRGDCEALVARRMLGHAVNDLDDGRRLAAPGAGSRPARGEGCMPRKP